MSVRIPAQAALDLLEGDLGVRVSKLLSCVPSDVDMVDAGVADLVPGSPADTAWDVLCGQPGIGWVTAGKLLARKRPRLLPVYDQVVRCVLGRPRAFWLALHAALRAGALDASPCGSSTGELLRGMTPIGRGLDAVTRGWPKQWAVSPTETAGRLDAPAAGDILPDLRCTKVPTTFLMLYLRHGNLVGISAGHERCQVPTSNPGHSPGRSRPTSPQPAHSSRTKRRIGHQSSYRPLRSKGGSSAWHRRWNRLRRPGTLGARPPVRSP